MDRAVNTLDVREVYVHKDDDVSGVLVLTVQDRSGPKVYPRATARLDRWQAKELYQSIGLLFDFFDGPPV